MKHFLFVTAFLALFCVQALAEDLEPTHKEAETISVPLDGEFNKSRIHTFTVAPDGKIYTSCGGETMVYSRTGPEMKKEPAAIVILDGTGKELDRWKLDITPQAITVEEDGTVYVGGAGKLLKLSSKGKVLLEADAPQIKDLPELPEIPEEEEYSEKEKEERAAAAAELQKQIDAYREKTQETFKILRDKDATDEEKKEARTELSKMSEKIRPIYSKLQDLKTSKRDLVIRERMNIQRKYRVSSIATDKKNLYVACPQAKGYGFALYKMTKDLKEPKQIKEGLRGCCGEMGISAGDKNVYVAENSRKRVLTLDNEGDQKLEIKSGERGTPEEFGSCCNPMNVFVTPDGSIYTSEASVGRIKKYSPDGKLQAVIGTVKIVPGCKHSPIGVYKDTVYMLDLTRKNIAVMKKQ